MKNILYTLLVCSITLFFTESSFAQPPSDAQIKKDIMNPGVLDIKLSNTSGKKVWSTAHSQYFFERGATVWRNAKIAEYPEAKVKIVGLARYHITGGVYSWREFKVAYNEYEGIPVPSREEIIAMCEGNMKAVIGSYRYNKIVGDLKYFRVKGDGAPVWHNPKSVSMNFEYAYDEIVSYTDVASVEADLEVRFYRDQITSPWKENVVSTEKNRNVLSTTTYSPEEIEEMPTLGATAANNAAGDYISNLPKVDVPQFASAIDLFNYTHKMLRESDKKTFEAYFYQVLGDNFFANPERTVLSANGKQVMDRTLKDAFNNRSSYKDQYCTDPGVKLEGNSRIKIYNKTNDAITQFAAGQYGGQWKNGVKQGMQWKLTEVWVRLLTSSDDIARLNSYEPGILCKDKSSLQDKGTPVRSTQSKPADQSQSESATEGSSGSNSSINKAKKFLNKLK